MGGHGRPSSALSSSSPNRPNQSSNPLAPKWPYLQDCTRSGWVGRSRWVTLTFRDWEAVSLESKGKDPDLERELNFPIPRPSYPLSSSWLSSLLLDLPRSFLSLKTSLAFPLPFTQPCGEVLWIPPGFFYQSSGFSFSTLQLQLPTANPKMNPKNSSQSQKHITLLDNPSQLRDFPNLACSLQMVQPQAHRMLLCFCPYCTRMQRACLLSPF